MSSLAKNKKTPSKLFFQSILFALCITAGIQGNAASTYGIAMHGDLKYPEDFPYFDYVNAEAPKGGTLRIGVVSDNFDSFNPFIIKGAPAAGVRYLYQTLTARSYDKEEAFSEYALIAEKIDVPADRSSVTFHLNSSARFDDGSPITTEDVAFSFDTLTTHERARPFYKAYYGDVVSYEIKDSKTITFKFKDDQNKELPLIMGQMEVLSKKYWEANDFGKSSLAKPIGNGPYVIDSLEPGRSITYKRNPNYWAKDLPASKGKYNFDKIVYEYYKDNTVALEAFKAGEYDYRIENTARDWANAYKGKLFDDKTLLKEEIKHGQPTGLQAFVINTRREIFQDARVRKALDYAFDFEWTNQNLFYSSYSRANSFFENSELAALKEPASGEVLNILKNLQEPLPERIFETPYSSPTTNNGNSLRKNLRTAIKLLKESGWQIKEGQLTRVADGAKFEFEILMRSKAFERVVQPYIKNLEKLGMKVSIRLVDTSQYINRVREFDFDVVISGFGQSDSPGNEQRDYWHSSRASQQGSRNLAGIKDPAIDKLIDLIIKAPDRKSLVYRTRALDRVLLAGHYVIPNWYNPLVRISYHKKLKRPEIAPKGGVLIDTWWIEE